MTNNQRLLTNYNGMDNFIQDYQHKAQMALAKTGTTKANKSYHNNIKIVNVLTVLQRAMQEHNIQVWLNPRDNAGVIMEVILKTLYHQDFTGTFSGCFEEGLELNKVVYDIKSSIKGSSSLTSECYQDTEQPILMFNGLNVVTIYPKTIKWLYEALADNTHADYPMANKLARLDRKGLRLKGTINDSDVAKMDNVAIKMNKVLFE